MPRSLSHHLQFPLLHFDKSANFRVLSVVRVFRELANKFAFFYLPLFLYARGGEVLPFIEQKFTAGMVLIGLYFILARIVVLLVAIPIGNIISKIGFGRAAVLGSLLHALFAALLLLSAQYPQLVFVAAVISGIEINFFWTAFNSLLSRNMHRVHVGADLSMQQVLVNIVALLSPALGGVVIVLLGYQALFGVGILLSLVSVVASFYLDSEPQQDTVSYVELAKWFRNRDFLREAVSFVGKYFDDATVTIWPLYVLLLLGTADKVGYLYTFSLFLALMVSYLFGSFADNSMSKKPMFVSGGLISLLWLVRTQVLGIWGIAVVDAFDRLVSNVHSLYFDRRWMLSGKGNQALSYFTYREVVISVGALLFWGLFIALFLLFDVAWNGLFVLTAVAVLFSLLIKDSSNGIRQP